MWWCEVVWRGVGDGMGRSGVMWSGVGGAKCVEWCALGCGGAVCGQSGGEVS